MILLDTDVCIALLRGQRKLIERRLEDPETSAVAAITAAELFDGAEKSANPEKNGTLVEAFLLTVPVLHTSIPILRLFGRLKAEIEREGKPLPDADILIAATALSHGGRLVTGHTGHFQRFRGLKLENWLR